MIGEALIESVGDVWRGCLRWDGGASALELALVVCQLVTLVVVLAASVPVLVSA